MSDDPFERFERSRGGLLIPLLLFILGAVPTTLAIGSMSQLAVVEHARRADAAIKDGAIQDVANHGAEEPAAK